MKQTKTIKEYVKGLELSLSDLFLAIGFLFFVPFAAFAWKFMVTPDPSTIILKDWMIIACFTISALCWAAYFYLEIKKGNIKNNIFTWLFVFFAVMSVVSVLVQPADSVAYVEAKFVNGLSEQYYPGIKVGDIVPVFTHITLTHRLFFTFGSLLITTIFFIIFFVFPKRVKSFDFLALVCIIIVCFILVITIYSYIAEKDHYGPFLQSLFKGDMDGVYANSVCSFLVQRVPYGVTLMLGLLFGILGHQITRHPFWICFGLYCLINMVFSWCKTALAISVLIVALYLVYLLVITFKDNKKRNRVLSIVYASFAGCVLIITLVSVISKGAFIPQIYKMFGSFTDSRTLRTRTYVWENINQQLKGGWLIIGRGFGTHNFMLYPMNLVNGDDVCPSHSTYYAVLGAGGIINLLGFLGMYVYYGYIFVKCWKVDKMKTLGLSVGVIAYFLYSFTEGVNYLILVFMFPLILYYHLNQKSQKTD